jgi:hypothetical protein
LKYRDRGNAEPIGGRDPLRAEEERGCGMKHIRPEVGETLDVGVFGGVNCG